MRAENQTKRQGPSKASMYLGSGRGKNHRILLMSLLFRMSIFAAFISTRGNAFGVFVDNVVEYVYEGAMSMQHSVDSSK